MKIKQQVSDLQEIEYLIKQMFNEIEIYRIIIERYRLKHGDSIEGGLVEVSDDIDFSVEKINGKDVTLGAFNFERLSLNPRFKSIKQKYNELI